MFKTISVGFAFAALVGSVSAAQYVTNGGFEVNGLSSWSQVGSYVYSPGSGTTTNTNLIFPDATKSHSGGHSAHFAIENWTWSTYHASLSQTISPVATANVSNASLWAYSFQQTLKVTIRYSDNTTSTATKTFGNGVNAPTWTQWDFKSILTPGKVINAIKLESESGQFSSGNGIWVDDISIATPRIVLP